MYKYGIKCEKIVCDKLSIKKYFSGIKLVPGSGKSFNRKEDIVGDDLLIQVKSTKDLEFNLRELDFKKLQANSLKFKKYPVFIVYFSEVNLIKIFVPYETYIDNLKDYLNKNIYLEEFIITSNKKVKANYSRSKICIGGIDYFSLNENDFI
jgi:Holliday junction resolvase